LRGLVAAGAGGAEQQGGPATARIGEHFPGGGIIEPAERRGAGDEQGQHPFGEDPGEQRSVEPPGGLQALGEAERAGFERVAFVIGREQGARAFLDQAVDRADAFMVLDDVMAQRRGDEPGEAVLELGGEVDRADVGLLEAVEAARADDHQLHRLGGDALVAVADQFEQGVLAGFGRMALPEAMLLDPADQEIAELGVAQRLGALENGQHDRHPRRRKRGMKRRMRFEADREAGAQGVLEAVDQAVEESGGSQPLPLGEADFAGQEQVGRGHGEALARGGQ
jgi:hypothetical protein